MGYDSSLTFSQAVRCSQAVAGTAGVYTGPGNVAITFAGKAITVSSYLGASITAVSPGYAARGFIFNNAEIFTSILNGEHPQHEFHVLALLEVRDGALGTCYKIRGNFYTTSDTTLLAIESFISEPMSPNMRHTIPPWIY